MMRTRFAISLLCLTISAGGTQAQAPDAPQETGATREPNGLQKVADSFVSAYNADAPDQISARFAPAMGAALSPAAFAKFLRDVKTQFGPLKKLQPLRTAPDNADFRATFERGELKLSLALNESSQIAGLRLSPLAATAAIGPKKPLARGQTRGKTRLNLPFRGEWLVFWGGDSREQNYHQDAPNQRFAFDILKVDAKGQTHRGDGSKNSDYFAFGQPILAPASGVVTDVVSGIRDNVPGQVNPMFAPGNMIVIRHSSGEYSLLAHLKLGSARVRVGDRVTQGQVLGLCGNSGNSSEAHLHYQLQKGENFADEGTFKAFFEKLSVRRDGKSAVKAGYSPVKGDLVSSVK